ncbi:uncharacterized protein [Rutidosis leptorrhynchoides]|uniref:uncharacterized protein n=1 Tax=Rutidosis leptorrhynchoides TaxID=125765 RepID=UPI003A99E75D
MTIATSPNSAAGVSIDNKMNKMINNNDEIEPEMKPDLQPQKLSGTTCHHCRQHKASVMYASCKNHARSKPCPLKYCSICLLNRYGENTEDVMLLNEWSCPRCRGVCNCSICMKKRGQKPTGNVVKMAKAGGFNSVSDLIDAEGAHNLSNYKRSKETTENQEMKQHLEKPKRKRVEVIADTTGFNDKKQKKVKSNGSKEISVTHNNQNASQHLLTGRELVTVAGVDLPKEDAGNALQFLEFCSTFRKILGVKKGQAETVLRDVMNRRSARCGKITSVIRFHVQLLSVILKESESESESEYESELKDKERIDATARVYSDLDSSMKLRLLIYLCDEVLGVEKIRNWMDDQNGKFEKRKEARDKLCAAKDKEKTLKQEPAEMLDCKSMVSADKEWPNAVRTDPIFKDDKGHLYWRLKGCSDKPGILLQDVGTGDDDRVEMVDKWFEYDDEQKDLIETHINVLRSRFKKHCNN